MQQTGEHSRPRVLNCGGGGRGISSLAPESEYQVGAFCPPLRVPEMPERNAILREALARPSPAQLVVPPVKLGERVSQEAPLQINILGQGRKSWSARRALIWFYCVAGVKSS